MWLAKDGWKGSYVLDGGTTDSISAHLLEAGAVVGDPLRLSINLGIAFQGSNILGMGFMMPPEQAREIITSDGMYADVLFPMPNGEDVLTQPDQSATRWVINFFDWPLNHETATNEYKGPVAADYPVCLEIVEEKVRPEREAYKPTSSWNKSIRARWWQFAAWRRYLLNAMHGLERVLVHGFVSKHVAFVFCPSQCVFPAPVNVFASDQDSLFAVLQSTIHSVWAFHYSSSLETRLRYTPSGCFENFPHPSLSDTLNTAGNKYHERRARLMSNTQQGLTKTYNRFHDPGETSEDIQKLRELHVEMDQAVSAAYGWDDLDLGHGFHETKQGIRYTISEPTRREVLQRLLKLNHERYEEEVKQGRHDKKKRGKSGVRGVGRKKKTKKNEPSLFNMEGEE